MPIAAGLVSIVTMFLLARAGIFLWFVLGFWDRPPKFAIGKETTYVTGPLDKDGYMDYEATLNDHLASGVTPARNANVLIWQALGPRPEGKPMLPEYFRRLGIEEPQEHGHYFVSLDAHVKSQAKALPGRQLGDVQKELDLAMQRPWTTKDHPILTDWLRVNEKPLAVVIEATKRPDYYNPLVAPRTKTGPGGLLSALIPSVQKCRDLAAALAARAMLRAHEGRLDEAWQDLLACHRLGRLVGSKGTLIEALVGMALDQVAGKADLAYLQSDRLTPRKVLDCLRDLQQLPPLPSIADKIDLTERCVYLELVLLMRRYGPGCLTEQHLRKDPDRAERWKMAGMDLDTALRTGNLWYDRIVAAMRIDNRAEREKQLNQIGAELEDLAKTLPSRHLTFFTELLLGTTPSDKLLGKSIGELLLALLLPATRKVQVAADRTEQLNGNLQLAFALVAYHGDHGCYPMTLEALAPKYLKQVPDDLFSGRALIYHPAENGYLLYSVGVNGKDEGGRGLDDIPRGDDLSVRMPLPKPKQ